MALPKYSLFFTRKYQVDGVDKVDKEIQLSEIACIDREAHIGNNSTPDTSAPENYYDAFAMTGMNFGSDYEKWDLRVNEFSQCKLGPANIFISKNFYTFDEIFPVEYGKNAFDYVEYMFNSLGPDSSGGEYKFRWFIFSDHPFIYDKEKNIYVYLTVRFAKLIGSEGHYEGWYHIGFFGYKSSIMNDGLPFDIHRLVIDDYHGRWKYKISEDEIYEVYDAGLKNLFSNINLDAGYGRWISWTSIAYGAFGNNVSGPYTQSFDECFSYTKQVINKDTKFYMCLGQISGVSSNLAFDYKGLKGSFWNVTYSWGSVNNYYDNSDEVNTISLLMYNSNTKNKGFRTCMFGHSNGVWSGWDASLASTPDWFKILFRKDINIKPEPTDPYQSTDPGADDPGHSGNPGSGSTHPHDPENDKGGDGDFDNTTNPILLPTPEVSYPNVMGAGLISAYQPTQTQLDELAGKLWSPDFWDSLKQMFTSPLDSIIGLNIVPVSAGGFAPFEIKLGGYATGVSAPKIHTMIRKINCGTIPISRYYGNYLDYSPYTKLKLYLPYIGEIDIDPDEAMQRILGVVYEVNVITGDLVGIVTLDGSVFYQSSGNCSAQLPISSTDYSRIIQTGVQVATGIALGIATAGVGGAAVGAASASGAATSQSIALASTRATQQNVASIGNTANNVMNAKLSYNHASRLAGCAGQLGVQKPYLTIHRPNLKLASPQYKSYVGYPGNYAAQLSTVHGFTRIETIRLAVEGATDEEVGMIRAFLLEGVIL